LDNKAITYATQETLSKNQQWY